MYCLFSDNIAILLLFTSFRALSLSRGQSCPALVPACPSDTRCDPSHG